LAAGLNALDSDYLIIEDFLDGAYTYRARHDTYLRYAASTPKRRRKLTRPSSFHISPRPPRIDRG